MVTKIRKQRFNTYLSLRSFLEYEVFYNITRELSKQTTMLISAERDNGEEPFDMKRQRDRNRIRLVIPKYMR